MKATSVTFLIAAMTILAAGQLQAGVKVGSGEVKERQIALRTPEQKFITTNPGNLLDFSGAKIGSKQTFTLLDLNGEDLTDGDEIKIRYTPNTGGKPDPSKASYWAEVKEGVKRSKQGDAFKIKKVETKYAIQAPSGKFLTGTAVEGIIGVTDKLEDALLVEILDISGGRDAAKLISQPAATDKPKAEGSAAAASDKPATEKPAAPADKPATE